MSETCPRNASYLSTSDRKLILALRTATLLAAAAAVKLYVASKMSVSTTLVRIDGICRKPCTNEGVSYGIQLQWKEYVIVDVIRHFRSLILAAKNMPVNHNQYIVIEIQLTTMSTYLKSHFL